MLQQKEIMQQQSHFSPGSPLAETKATQDILQLQGLWELTFDQDACLKNICNKSIL